MAAAGDNGAMAIAATLATSRRLVNLHTSLILTKVMSAFHPLQTLDFDPLLTYSNGSPHKRGQGIGPVVAQLLRAAFAGRL